MTGKKRQNTTKQSDNYPFVYLHLLIEYYLMYIRRVCNILHFYYISINIIIKFILENCLLSPISTKKKFKSTKKNFEFPYLYSSYSSTPSSSLPLPLPLSCSFKLRTLLFPPANSSGNFTSSA
jgi:hypothetical protein